MLLCKKLLFFHDYFCSGLFCNFYSISYNTHTAIKSPIKKATRLISLKNLRSKFHFSSFFSWFWKWNLTIQILLSVEIKCYFSNSLNYVLSSQQERTPTKIFQFQPIINLMSQGCMELWELKDEEQITFYFS